MQCKLMCCHLAKGIDMLQEYSSAVPYFLCLGGRALEKRGTYRMIGLYTYIYFTCVVSVFSSLRWDLYRRFFTFCSYMYISQDSYCFLQLLAIAYLQCHGGLMVACLTAVWWEDPGSNLTWAAVFITITTATAIYSLGHSCTVHTVTAVPIGRLSLPPFVWR